jgi:hypothetical protein
MATNLSQSADRATERSNIDGLARDRNSYRDVLSDSSSAAARITFCLGNGNGKYSAKKLSSGVLGWTNTID